MRSLYMLGSEKLTDPNTYNINLKLKEFDVRPKSTGWVKPIAPNFLGTPCPLLFIEINSKH